MNMINTRNVRKAGVDKMIQFGFIVQLIMALALVVVTQLNVGFIPFVLFVAGAVGCISMISSNAMALILEGFPYMAGTAASLAGVLRFGVGALVGLLLSHLHAESAWPMVISIFLCCLFSAGFYHLGYYSSKKKTAN